MLGRRVYAVFAMCLILLAAAGCRGQDAAADRNRPDGPAADVPSQRVAAAPAERRQASDEPGNDPAWPADPGAGGGDRLPDAEITARMGRPIEESIYDPALTQAEKLDLLLRHYSIPGNHVTEPDALMDAVMTEGMTPLEAAEYWAGQGGSRKWALHHAEAALRDDPKSVDALALWARKLPLDRARDRHAAFLAVLELDPTHGDALANLASGTTMDQPFESMEYAQRLLDVYPESGFGYSLMGRAYERLGDPETAASYYDAGLEVGPGFIALRWARDFLRNGQSPIQPVEPAVPAPEPKRRPDAASPSDAPTSPPVEGPGPSAEPRSPGGIPGPPAPTPETPEPVQRYRNAVDDYRSLADEFENITGKKYGGLQNLDGYAKQSTNWMAWRYMELAQQYLEAGKPGKAAEVFEKAERQFPDDPLIQERMERRR